MIFKKLKFPSLIRELMVITGVVFLIAIPSVAYAGIPPGNLVVPPVNSPTPGTTGLVGTIPSSPPSVAATISTPTNSQTFTTQPYTVTGICTGNLLIELFDNGIFTGSATCNNNTYSIVSYLFNGSNILVVQDFDALNQSGPNSNTVTVNFNNPNSGASPGIVLTSNYANIGQNPGSQLTFPIILSNGNAPYALDISWGDSSANTLISKPIAGTININHTYKQAGVYTILVHVTDSNNNSAYLQLVAVADGKVNQANLANSSNGTSLTKSTNTLSKNIIWVLAIIVILSCPIVFWLGIRHERQIFKRMFERGERPFVK